MLSDLRERSCSLRPSLAPGPTPGSTGAASPFCGQQRRCRTTPDRRAAAWPFEATGRASCRGVTATDDSLPRRVRAMRRQGRGVILTMGGTKPTRHGGLTASTLRDGQGSGDGVHESRGGVRWPRGAGELPAPGLVRTALGEGAAAWQARVRRETRLGPLGEPDDAPPLPLATSERGGVRQPGWCASRGAVLS